MNELQSKNELQRIVVGIDEDPDGWNMDDLHECGVEDLQMKFGLLPNDTFALWLIIDEMTNSRSDMYGLSDTELNRQSLYDMIQEDIHGTYYGSWSTHDRLVIRAYMTNLCIAVRLESQRKERTT